VLAAEKDPGRSQRGRIVLHGLDIAADGRSDIAGVHSLRQLKPRYADLRHHFGKPRHTVRLRQTHQIPFDLSMNHRFSAG
jgi:hypothetical protein